MSQEERQMTPGEVLQEAGETFEGDAVDNFPGNLDWQNVPFAPPFQSVSQAVYPQVYQVPLSYFPGVYDRLEGFAGVPVVTGASAEESGRHYFWDTPYLNYGWFQHPFYASHYRFHYDPYHSPYQNSFSDRGVDGTDSETNTNSDEKTAEVSQEDTEESRQLVPFIGISPFGPSFGIGFGGPFYPYPWWYYPRPFYPYPRPFYPYPRPFYPYPRPFPPYPRPYF